MIILIVSLIVTLGIIPILACAGERYHIWSRIAGKHVPNAPNSWEWIGKTYLKWILIGCLIEAAFFIMTHLWT